MAESNPRVSIIIPCYQQGRFLSDAVSSALAQTYPSIETIVVNDGSTDETDSVVRQFGNRIVYLTQENSGVASARNAGIAVAQGDYLLFLDADDVLRRDAVAKMVAAAAGECCVVVQGWQCFSDSPKQAIEGYFVPDFSGGTLPLLFYTNPIGPPAACLCPRDAVGRVGGFCCELAGTEDWDLWIRLAMAGVPFRTIEYLGVLYRRHSASASTRTNRMFEGKIDVLLRVHQRLSIEPDLMHQLGPHLFQSMRDLLRKAIARGRVDRRRWTALVHAIEQLRCCGSAGFATWHERWADRLLGLRAEWLRVGFWRVFQPKLFRYMARTPA